MALGLSVAELARQRGAVLGWALECKRCFLAAGWFTAQLRQPLNLLFLAAFLPFLVGLALDGELRASRPSRMTPHPQHLLYAAFLLFLARLTQWYWQGGRDWLREQPLVLRQLAAWHVLPVLMWFTWPKRLAHFAWYMTRNHGGEVQSWQDSVTFYRDCLSHEYHLGGWSLILAGLLVLAAVVTCRRLRPGAVGILCFLVLVVALNFKHHSKRSRFLHSWIATMWVVGGAGLGQLFAWQRLGKIGPVAASLGVAGLAFSHAPGLIDSGGVKEGGPHPEQVSMAMVPNAFLADLDQERQVALVSNIPLRNLLNCTYVERHGHHRHLLTHLRGLPFADLTKEQVRGWLEKTPCTALVHVQFTPGTRYYEHHAESPQNLLQLLHEQDLFALQKEWRLDGIQARITLWKRGEPSYSARLPHGP